MCLVILRLFVLCLAIQVAWCKRDESVCEVYTKSCGLIPPPLPTNFEYKGELANYVTKSLAWTELYFDSKNQQGKYTLVSNNLEYHFLFDYNVEQIITYVVLHPGSPIKRDPLTETCVAEPMDGSKWRYIFGYRDGNVQTKRSRMYNSYQLLRYGDQYQYSANGTVNLESRGLRTNAFNSCVYDEFMDVTVAATILFSDSDTLLAGATPMYKEDGVSVGLLSVPLSLRYNGTFTTRDQSNQPKKQRYDVEQSLSWFQGDPVFKYGTFKIPEAMFCKNYRGFKTRPELPPAFGTRLELSVFTQDFDGKMISSGMYMYQQIWYNARSGLARTDFTPLRERNAEIYNKFQDMGPVKVIYDFTAGVLYITNKASGRCFARPIEFGDFFETSKEKMFIAMASPEELFFMESDVLEYKGKDFARDIYCDIWAGTDFNERINMTVSLETYFSTEGWHEETDEATEYGIPIRHTIRTNKIEDGEFQQTVLEYNFFKFKASPPPFMLFDIYNTGCMDTIDHRYLGVLLSVTKDEFQIVQKYRFYFLEAAQYALANVSKVLTPIRIQRLQLHDISKWHMLTFVLLEKTKLQTSIPTSQSGASMAEAVENLRKYIGEGKLVIKFKNPETNEDQPVVVQQNGLVVFKWPFSSPTQGEFALEDVEFLNQPSTREYEMKPQFADNDKKKQKPKVTKGMSPGGLAGLAIAMLIIGIGVGIGVMYLYIRRYSDQNIQDQYAMQNQR